MNHDDPNQSIPSAQTPEEPEPPDISPPGTIAAGMPAILESFKFARSEMGVVRGFGTLLKINQPGGIDCPGCAWPDPDHGRSHFEFCENGVKHVTEEATSKRVTSDFFEKWSVSELSQQSDLWLEGQGRLTQPMLLKRDANHYEPVDWDAAFKLIAEELNSLDHPDQAVFYTSGRTSNEAAFLYQLFVRQFGTNNLPDCSNMCHESSGWALSQSIGVGKGTVTLDDFDRAEAIFVIGQNPGTNHPRMLTSLLHAKRNGCKLVHINPLHETGMNRFKHPQEVLGLLGSGTKLADLFLQVRVNGDVALLKGISKAVLEREEQSPGAVLDHKFINDSTAGYEQFVAGLKDVSWQQITSHSGVEKDQIEEAAEIFVSSKRTIFCWAMGLTQHRNAVANIQEIVNLMLLRGQVGLPGAGFCPVRGHSNVQGDRTVGIWESPTAAFLDRLAAQFKFEPPRHHGLDTVNSIQAMHEGRIRVFFAMGGNFLSATPDTEFTAAALRKCRLTAHVSTKLNRSHLITGKTALILPCLGRTELDQQSTGPQFVTTENSMGVIQMSLGQLQPASNELLSEPQVVAKLARATLGSNSTVDWEGLAADYDRIRDAIEKVIPGFEDYNVRVRHDAGFYLPNTARERVFQTPGGKAQFTVHDLPAHQLEANQFLMMTIRSHDQFNTSVYSLNDRYRGISNGRRVVFLNPADIASQGLSARQEVDLVSHFEGEERVAKGFSIVPYDIPSGCAATYFPEANVLVPIRSVAEKSNTPASKSVVISIRTR
ncbi:MAG TPA: FdhF/YdeP family oxidoreductase [Pyrinomonadaceae bacterium]|nr:FdhF/YdeP family oxidoreductase [Pyrinomonadaceae bacterium]